MDNKLWVACVEIVVWLARKGQLFGLPRPHRTRFGPALTLFNAMGLCCKVVTPIHG